MEFLSGGALFPTLSVVPNRLRVVDVCKSNCNNTRKLLQIFKQFFVKATLVCWYCLCLGVATLQQVIVIC